MDVHRNFAQIAVVENGLCRDEGRIGMTPEALREWADTLEPDDEVALEATGNSDAIAILVGHPARPVGVGQVSGPGRQINLKALHRSGRQPVHSSQTQLAHPPEP
jgi:hypothetical protein